MRVGVERQQLVSPSLFYLESAYSCTERACISSVTTPPSDPEDASHMIDLAALTSPSAHCLSLVLSLSNWARP